MEAVIAAAVHEAWGMGRVCDSQPLGEDDGHLDHVVFHVHGCKKQFHSKFISAKNFVTLLKYIMAVDHWRSCAIGGKLFRQWHSTSAPAPLILINSFDIVFHFAAPQFLQKTDLSTVKVT